MKRLFVVTLALALALSMTALGADTKEVLQLKQKLLTEQKIRYQAQLKAVQYELAEAFQKANDELQKVEAELKKIEAAEKKEAAASKKEAAAEKK